MNDTAILEAPAAAAPVNPLATVAALQAPDRAAVMKPADQARAMANMMTVTNALDRELAVEEIQGIKASLKELDRRRRTVTDPLNEAVKAVNALFKPAIEALEGAEGTLKNKVIAFDRAEEARIAEQRRIADEQARAAAAAAAEAAAKAAAAAEAEARAAQEKAQAEAAAGNFEAAAAHEMAAAHAQAQAAEVVAVATTAVTAAPAPIAAPVKKGTASRTKWSAELVSLQALVEHVAKNPSLIGLLQLDQRAADKMASALEAQMAIPGLKPVSSQSLAVRSK
jgi:hypothetical protein